MRVVYAVQSENRVKAEDLLKKDEIVNRGSIAVRSAGSLDLSDDVFFIIYDGSPEAVKVADALLAGIAVHSPKAAEVLRRFDEQENAAIEGFGNILG